MALIFHAINGIGLGHLARQLQVAREVRRKRPNTAMYFLTSAEWNQWLYEEGIPFYYIPSAPEYRVTGSLREWDPLPEEVLRRCSPPGLAESFLRLVVEYHSRVAIVFDSFFPVDETLSFLASGTAVFCVIDAYTRLETHSFQALLENGGTVLVAADLESEDWVSHPQVVHVGRILREVDEGEKQSEQYSEKRFRIVCVQGGGGFKRDNSLFYQRNAAFSEVVGSALRELRRVFGDQIKAVFVLGPYGSVEDTRNLPLWVEVRKNITNVPTLLSQSDLLISRGGYSAISDSISSGCPGIFLPIREPVEDQMQHIADLTRAGLGFVSGHDVKELTDTVATLVRNPAKLKQIRERLHSRKANAKGAQRTADHLCSSIPNDVLLSAFTWHAPGQ